MKVCPAMRSLRLPQLPAVFLLFLVASCGGEDNGAQPTDRLCNGEAGLAAHIEGRSSPIDVCLNDADVSVLLTSSSRYDIAAQAKLPGVTVQIRMVFSVRPDAPVSLSPVSTLDEAIADADAVWIWYEEIPDRGDAIESSTVAGGSFRLTFSDDKILAGTIKDIALTMRNVTSGDEVGTRRVSEGFFSLSVKNPVAAPLALIP
jgi:hypothetical protein